MALIWEKLESEGLKAFLIGNLAVWRAKVPGGWLVYGAVGEGAGIAFYPDPEHKWDGSSLP